MMKKHFNFAFLGAIALIGSSVFVSCSSGEDLLAEEEKQPTVADNPGYDAETGTVPVQFVMNVSTGNTTRMSSGATQATTTDPFRGIDHAFFLTLKQADNDGHHLAASTTADRLYDLSQVLAANTISTTNSRRVLEMSLPLNTNTLLFYGKAIEGTPTAAQTAKGLTAYDVFGHLKTSGGYTVETDLDNVAFEVSRRLTDDKLSQYTKVQQLLAAMLTSIMATNLKGDNHQAISATNTPGTGIPAYGFDVATDEYNEVTWGDFVPGNPSPAIGTNIPLTPLEEKLAAVYKEMTTIQQDAGELRAGSGSALERMLQDLWTVVNEVRCATPTSKAEAVAKFLATRINGTMGAYLNGSTPADGKPVTDVSMKDVNTLAGILPTAPWPATADAKPTGFSSIASIQLSNFPHNFNLPEGATHLDWDTDKKQFEYVIDYNTSGIGGTTFTVSDYFFSPELLYFGNSPIRVSNTSYKTSDYPQTVAAWDDDASWGSTWEKNKHVVSTTRSVAMINDVNYGTALLKTQVGYKSGVSVLYDNNKKIQKQKNPATDEPNKAITVNGNSFQLVGVIVGGQPKQVGWNFLKKGDAMGYVYDLDIPNSAIPTSGLSEANYTLLFDNWKNDTQTNQDVIYVALELVNNTGVDFFGQHGLIRDGGIFYLIGQLDPNADGLAAVTWPTHHPLPPYNSNGTSVETTRVFMQDYMTTATFRLGEYSLQYAYLTVPDLRSSSLTLGLSVDISWSTGLNFADVILGGTTQQPLLP